MTEKMATRRLMTFALTLSLMVLSATALAAQDPEAKRDAWDGYRDVRHRNDCRLAHQVLTNGQPANKRAWALRVIPTCGPLGGEAVAKLLHDHRNATQRTEEYDEIVLLATRLTDRSIFEAAMELAQDQNASELARIQSIRALYYQMRPGSFADYETFVTPEVVPFSVSTYNATKGDPLPEDALIRILNGMAAICSDPEASEALREAARTTRSAAAGKLQFEEDCGDISLEECMRRTGIIPQ